MYTAFSTALSALNANSTAISVVGSNLANLNTSGYKAGVVLFRDMVTNSLGAGLGETQARFGVAQPSVFTVFNQGVVQPSSGALDAAIEGDGFFVVKDSQDGTLYTRCGNFHVDDQGRLLTATGERVQGWTVDPSTGEIATNAPVGDIEFAVGWLKPPIASSEFSLDLNLNALAATSATTPDLSYPVQVYDALGSAHTLTINFNKTATAGAWTYTVTMDGGDIVGGTAGTAVTLSTGPLTFNSSGQLTAPTAAAPITFTLEDLASGAADLDITWNLYNAAGRARLTQYDEASTVSGNEIDGSAASQLMRVGLADGGKIVAQFSDEQQMVVGQLAVAAVRNPESLSAQGDNNFRASMDTATPVIGMPGTGGRGEISGSALESSTVDIATEFTNLIVYQRAYQANSRVVTAADDISQETINLIR